MAIFNCDVCGQAFERVPGHAARNKMGLFCSRECFGVFERKDRNPAWTGGLVTLRCPCCQKTFEAKQEESRRRRYCSTECVSNACQDSRRRPCATCGKEFVPRQYSGPMEYCSPRCASIAHRTAIRGERNGRYVSGAWTTAYTPGFPKSLRRQIVARDGHRCVHCEATGILQVHHLDGSKTNHDPTNLVTLCVSCHRTVHTKIGINADWMNRYGSSLFAAARRLTTSLTLASDRTTTTTQPAS